MELAVEEGEHSIPEHDDREDPFVRAILATKDGEILAKAHRGELRVGEHCEFTLLERKLRDRNLTDCVLYVTLEPCTDEARNDLKGKRGCATHIVRARIGTVYVGIDDPNPNIRGLGIRYLISNRIVVHPFPLDLQERISKRNAKFIKEKEEEAKRVHLEIKKEEKTLLEKGAPRASIKIFDEQAIDQFIFRSKLPYQYPSNEFNEWAAGFGILEQGLTKEELIPTGLGLMLFGQRPGVFFPQAVFKVEINYDSGEAEVRDFDRPLITQFPEIIDYVKNKGLKLTMDRSSGQRVENPDFPLEVLRESIANAIMHRDYSIDGATNYLYIDPNKIIVRSPGDVAEPLTINDLEEFKAPSFSRNPKIAYAFYQMGYAELRGVGLRTMKLLPEQGFPLPTFEMQAGNLVVTFARTRTGLGKSGMSETEYKEWLYIQSHEPVTRAQFAKEFGLPSKTAQNHLSRLIDMGMVFTRGKGKAIRYFYRRA